MNILLAGGGSGGHIFPGLALAEALGRARSDVRVSFVGTEHGLDRQLLDGSGYALHRLAVGRGSPLQWRRPLNLPRFLWAVAQCERLFARERPAAVVALGGFAAAIPAGVAHRRRLPLFVLEPNAWPGRVNRRIAPWARAAFLLFDEARARFPSTPAEFHVAGYPLRPAVRALAASAPVHGDALLVVGGSQGARRLNALVVNTARAWRAGAGDGACILHVAGDAHRDAVAAVYRERAPEVPVEVFGFHDDMPSLLRRARVMVARAGTGAITDAAAAGVPALFVPLSTSMEDHQRINAEAVERAVGAPWVDETSITPDAFAQRLLALWNDDALRDRLTMAWRAFLRPDAADAIASHIIDMLESNDGHRASPPYPPSRPVPFPDSGDTSGRCTARVEEGRPGRGVVFRVGGGA